ncbi:MAG: hypothetical protein MRJ68_02095 [Nitrospira sp.]|nr:hypothetical protein [Nitrospira sp.]
MPGKWVLIGLSVLIVLGTAIAIYYLNDVQLSSYGTVVAAAGSLLAVIWFSGSLWYQAQQLREQRTQFLEQFKQLREEGRRDALLLARDILNAAEARALAMNPEIRSLSDLFPLYTQFAELKDILESEDPKTVESAINSWVAKEGPALALMKGLKSAAEVYFFAVGKRDVDYSKEPEEFVYIYGSQLWVLPFFEAFQVPATMLAGFMVRLEPGRKSVTIAGLAAMARLGHQRFLKMDSIREDIKTHMAKGYPLPKIAEGL